MSALYLPRDLWDGERTYSEEQLLEASNHVVILAEPGAGKTELMGSLALKLQVSSVTANLFRHVGPEAQNSHLLIDAFDELAKIDRTGINALLADARKAKPIRVIISSRSSEWDTAATVAFKTFLGADPLVVKLSEFNEEQQRQIFDAHLNGEDFSAFRAEISRFELEPLLPNPQFLKIFADAYIESGRRFANKRSIFSQALERLVKETNGGIARSSLSLSTSKKIELSSEVFAKLLLSGAEGVSTTEFSENRAYPFMASIFDGQAGPESILATRIFKPADSPDHHRPIHKIVAEYCAANYLADRIKDPKDFLTFSKCLAIIAPNSTVRDELRGMLGWMATLGSKAIQIAAIELDPYAVLSNGDPSQLDLSSKNLLIKKLVEVESRDPYFRRGDNWRRFSVAGFFTQEIVEEIKPLLTRENDGHLRTLILEILRDSSATEKLQVELVSIVLSSEESENVRMLAIECLVGVPGRNYTADLNYLIFEKSHTSLRLVASSIEILGPRNFDIGFIANFLRACSNLYPTEKDYRERSIVSRYFVRRFIRCLGLSQVEWLLQELSGDTVCRCTKDIYECSCLYGISKVVAILLDRFFELSDSPYDPQHVWEWIKNLRFPEQKDSKDGRAIQVLRHDNNLRQGIISIAFSRLSDRVEILNVRRSIFGWYGHSGLTFQSVDHFFIVDLAFENSNSVLWGCFFAEHQYFKKAIERGTDLLRHHMRLQALAKPEFMCEWVKGNVEATKRVSQVGLPKFKRNRKLKRRRSKQNNIRLANIAYVNDNRDLVESGRHWRCLVRFAELVLMDPDKIEYEFGDESIVRNALRNCLDFVSPEIPNLTRLAELQCASQGLYSEMILYAACLEIMRARGNLERVDRRLLSALRTGINMHYNAVSEQERNALKEEVDRLIFPDLKSAEIFLRQYLEPQLLQLRCNNPEVWLLQAESPFDNLREKLSVEWLGKYKELSGNALHTLFEIAAEHGDRKALQDVISRRCIELLPIENFLLNENELEQGRKFWFVRAWYFLEAPNEIYWDWLKLDRENLLVFEQQSSRTGANNHPYWPRLSPGKIEAILDAFFDAWPKVELPDNWGSRSPKEENAYRFLKEIVWSIDSSQSDDAIPVLKSLLADSRFEELHKDLKSILAGQIRKEALRNFKPPMLSEVIDRLDRDMVVTVEGLRQVVIQELYNFQKSIDGGEFNSVRQFYEKDDRLNELRSAEIIAERLSIMLEPQGICVTPEHQLKNANRSDFTVAKIINGRRRLLVAEVKGQWHKDLYTAASAQLYERYSIHPDAEQQGVYLVMWFGENEKVAGRVNHGIASAQDLKNSIEKTVPPELKGLIDVFVLDVSRSL